MARVEIEHTVQSGAHPVSGASVYVYIRGTTTQQPVYETAVSVTPLAQPLRTVRGEIEGWVDEGSYDLSVSWGSSAYTKQWEAWFGSTISDARRWFPVPTGGDDAPELLSRLGSGENEIVLRRNTYRWQQAVALPANARLQGVGRHLTTVLHDFNGDLGTLDEGASFANIAFDGNGKTGKGWKITGATGRQHAENFKITGFADYCLDFQHIDAGSQSTWINGVFAQLVGTAIGQEAIHITDTQQLAATPRKFIACESNGKRFIHLGGCNGLYIVGGGYIGELVFTAESRGVTVAAVRLAGPYTPEGGILHVKGFNHTINGDVSANVVIDAGYSSIHIDGTFNGTVTDNSGFADLNMVTHARRAYTPALTAAGGAPAVGNGTIIGDFSRAGSMIHFSIEFTIGSTTNLGTGEIRLSLPLAPPAGINQVVAGHCTDASAFGDSYNLIGVLSPTLGYLSMRSNAAGVVSATSPITFAAGDVIRVSGSYQL
jgi:hypothetical protein